jgi:Golgi nucleoside diphosphatase
MLLQFGWIAVNYLKQTIGPFKPAISINKQSAYVVIEMGGASTQVTQVAKTIHDERAIEDKSKFEFTTQDEKIVLYSHSYLGYGAEKAREGLTSHLVSKTLPSSDLKDPCLNPGYSKPVGTSHASIYEGVSSHQIVGAGSEDNCHQAVEAAMFSKRHGGHDLKCKKNSTTVSFDCIHQPSFVRKSENILVFENFFYTAYAVGTMPANHETNPAARSGFPLHTSPKEFLDSAAEVCPLPWGEMSARYPKEVSQNTRWCFSATYAYLFLTHGIGLENHQAITVQQSIGSADVEWALGATYKELSDELVVARQSKRL